MEVGGGGQEALPSWAHSRFGFLIHAMKLLVFILTYRPDDQERTGNLGSILAITLLRMLVLSMGPTFSLPPEAIWPELISFVFIVITYLRPYNSPRSERFQPHGMFYFYFFGPQVQNEY